MIIFINLYWEILTKRADSALYINEFLPNVPFLYTLKTSEEKNFSYIFTKYEKGRLGGNGLINITEYKPALTLQCVTSQNGQVHFKNLAAFAAIFLKCV